MTMATTTANSSSNTPGALTLRGNITARDVDKLKPLIRTDGREGNTLRIRYRHPAMRMTSEVKTSIIELLKLAPKHEWESLFINTGANKTDVHLEHLLDTVIKLDIFQSISHNDSSPFQFKQEEGTSSSDSSGNDAGSRLQSWWQQHQQERPHGHQNISGAAMILAASSFSWLQQLNSSLQTLKLSGPTMNYRCAVSLCQGLKSTTSLLELKLCFRSYDKCALTKILEGIEGNASIEILDVSGNFFSEQVMLKLINSITTHPATISSLNLSRNYLQESRTLKCLAQALMMTTTESSSSSSSSSSPANKNNNECKLAELKMNQCGLHDMRPFFDEMVRSNSTLKLLDLSENRDLACLTYILENVYKLQGLEKLLLGCCFQVVTPPAIPPMTKMTRTKESTSSSLSSSCCCGDEKMNDHDTTKNNHLKHLDLSMNTVRDSGLDGLLCFCAAQIPGLETLLLVKTWLTNLSLPKFLAEEEDDNNNNIDSSSATTPFCLSALKKLNLGVLDPAMLPQVSKLVQKLPALVYVGAGYRIRDDKTREWDDIVYKLDQRRFPVSAAPVRPLSLWPIIFEKVNKHFSFFRWEQKRIEFLHGLVHGPGMPLVCIALERQQLKQQQQA